MRKMFGTMLATEDYALGARRLYDSLKTVNSIYQNDFFILLASNINIDNIKKIFPEKDVFIANFNLLNVPNLDKDERIKYTINKIYAFQVPVGIKLCLVDSDIYFIKNCDHYLDFPAGSAYPAAQPPHSANGGVIIFENDFQSFLKGKEIIDNFNGDFRINDEYIWKELWQNFSTDYEKHLPIGDWYNNEEQMRVVHEDGFPKQWMIN